MRGLRNRLLTRAASTAVAIDEFLITPELGLAEMIRGSAHKIAGIAATLGLPELGSFAASVDEAPLPVPPGELAIEHLTRLRQAITIALEGEA